MAKHEQQIKKTDNEFSFYGRYNLDLKVDTTDNEQS